MSALGKVVRSGVSRRWVQTVAIALATAAAVTSGVLGVGLLVASNAPFDHAFAAQHGAHLTVTTDPTKATTAQLTATRTATGVAEATGPFAVGQVEVFPPAPGVAPGTSPASPEQFPPDAHGFLLSVAARAPSGTGVDRLTLTDGRWATNPNEVVLNTDGDFSVPQGITMTVGRGTAARVVTVVGLARSVSRTADAWMTPAGLAALHPDLAGYQMLYRLSAAGETSRLDAARDAISAALPTDAVTSARTWLTVKKDANAQTSLFVPFLLVFGALSLLLSVLIVGTVIAGAVSSTLRRIGILKAVGFTPAQVVRAYVLQALVPASVGAVLGVVVGNLVAIPVLSRTEEVYGTVALGIAPWVDVVVLVAALALVLVTASTAAGRAGRLSAVDALAVGRTPTAGRGQYAGRLAARLPLPRPVTLGLARPFSSPVRAAAMVVSIAFGAAAVTLAAGLASSLHRVQLAADHSAADIVVDGTPDPSRDTAAVARALQAQAGTAHWLGLAESEASVAGLTGQSSLLEYTADPGWVGYELVSGRWFTKPGEAVVPTELLRAADKKLGDSFTIRRKGESMTLTIVGEVFDPGNNDGLVLTSAGPGTRLTSWQVAVADGTDSEAYATAVQKKLEPLGLQAYAEGAKGVDDLLIVIDALAGLLTLLLVAVAGLGVLNSVVLDVRERVHDIGVHKALGMTPRQTLTAVLSSVALIGLAGGLIGVPVGVAIHRLMLPAMGRGAGVELPRVVMSVYGPRQLAVFALGGLVLATAGALLPAGWAAKTRTATALRTE